MAEMTSRIVVCLLSLSLTEVNCFQSEFLHSFLSYPWLLSNLSMKELPASEEHLATVTVSVDNWTPYDMSVGLGSSNYGTYIPVRNANALDRTFATRTANPEETAGLAGWHLIDSGKGGAEVGRLTLGWKASNEPGTFQFGAALGRDFLESIDALLGEDGGGINNDRITVVSKRDPGTLTVERSGVLVAVEGKALKNDRDFLLKTSVLFPNVDVWWWKKYFNGKAHHEKTSTTSLPATKKSHSGEKPLRADEPRRRRKEEDLSAPPLFERKDLLPQPSLLRDLNITSIREALLTETRAYWVALGLCIENWSRRKLVAIGHQFESGKFFRKLQTVAPGSSELAIITHEEGTLSGTLGLMRYKIEPFDSILSVMWSVPYNRQLWKSWAAVGLTNTVNAPSIEEMYSAADPTRFIREKAGRKFEFSDGQRYLVSAEMDGGLTYKPILKISLVPYEKKELPNSVKKQLGLPLHKSEDILDPPPQTRLVQFSNGSSLHRINMFIFLALFVYRKLVKLD